MGCLCLEIKGQLCLVGSVDQGMMKNRHFDLLDGMTQKGARKKNILVIPHSDVTRKISANNPPKKFANF